MKTHLIAALAVLVLVAACNRATDTVIPNDPTTWDKDLAPAIAKLSDDDKALVRGYLLRVKLGELFNKEGVPIGTTLATAIEDQKKWKAEQAKRDAEAAALKEKLELESAAQRDVIAKAVTVALLSKRQLASDFRAGRYSDSQEFRIAVKNKGDKELVGVSGRLQFIDVFDKEVGAVTFDISQKIKPDGEYTWIGSRDYNQFIKEHRAIWDLEEGKYTTRFEPSALVYKDGTKLDVGAK